MKKLSALLTALTLSMTAVTSFNAYADPEEGYLPVMYLSVEDNEKITILPDGTVYINNKNLTGDDSIRVNVYVRDESKSCWNVAPKVKCKESYIKFNEKPIDPKDVGETSAYNPSSYGFWGTVDKEYNTVNMTINVSYKVARKLESAGENTDDYPVAYFDADINSEIPAGNYRIYFLTDPEDEEDQRTSVISFRYDNDESQTFTPEVRDQKIIVSDRMFGDVDGDGKINAVDATLISIEYASLSVIDPVSTFTVGQTNSADVNVDGRVDANDATAIQCYYAYLSTEHDLENELDFATYLATEFTQE